MLHKVHQKNKAVLFLCGKVKTISIFNRHSENVGIVKTIVDVLEHKESDVAVAFHLHLV